ncbi:MAG TPA: AI-2E family transporter, partial [Candidatus Saccharimonadia bacterium]
MERKRVTVAIETSTIVRVLLLVLAFVGSIWLVTRVATPLVWVLVAIFLAVSLDPAVNGLMKALKVSRLWATGIVFALFVGFVSFMSASLVPPLVNQTQAFATQLPGLVQQAENSDTYLSRVISDYDLVNRAHDVQDDLIANITTGNGTALGIVVSIFSGLAAALTILTFTFFMLLEGPHWVRVLGNY